MIPFGNETVTLVCRGENIVNGRTAVSYSTEILTGCSWRRTYSAGLRGCEGRCCFGR